MPTTPALNARVLITVKDINNNSVAKQFNYVTSMHFDYFKGVINIVDSVQGSFFFTLMTITSLTYTITTGVNGLANVVMS